MPAPRLPDVLFGTGDALEHFMGDYLVGMFDNAAPLVIAPVDALQVVPVFDWRGMSVFLVSLPPGGVTALVDDVDVIDLDLTSPVARSVEGVAVPPAPAVGAQAVRVAAGRRCVREAGPMGAAWLQFRGAA